MMTMTPDDQIKLRGLRGLGHHGVLSHEKENGQTFIVDVDLGVDLRAASKTDDLALTVDYGSLAAKIVARIENDPVDLIETLARSIARIVLESGPVQWVAVTVHKPGAPIEVPFDDVSVTIRRDRSDLPELQSEAPVAAPASVVASASAAPMMASPVSPVSPDSPAVEPPQPTAGDEPASSVSEENEANTDHNQAKSGQIDIPDFMRSPQAFAPPLPGGPLVTPPSAPHGIPLPDLSSDFASGETAKKQAEPDEASAASQSPAAPERSALSQSPAAPEGPKAPIKPSGMIHPSPAIALAASAEAGANTGPGAGPRNAEQSDDDLDAAPNSPAQVILALGSNEGDSLTHLREAIKELDGSEEVTVTGTSALARTAAVGNTDQADFFNLVLSVQTTLAPRKLLALVHDIENKHGRVRTERWGPRTLDIDIIDYDGMLSQEPDLILPHPRAHERAFVLLPWSQLSPTAQLSGLAGGPVSELAASAPDRSGVRWLALDWLDQDLPIMGAGPKPADPEH